MRTEHPLFAALYDTLTWPGEWWFLRNKRERVVGEARGRVLELGVGTGLNLSCYRQATQVIALDSDPYMLMRARRRAPEAAVPVEIQQGSAECLPYPDASFDTVVATLVFCTIPDPRAALREVHRILMPHGTFRFLEHIRSERPRTARLQDALTPPWRKLFGGCHLNRETLRLIMEEGFRVTRLERHRKGILLLGEARTG